MSDALYLAPLLAAVFSLVAMAVLLQINRSKAR